MNIRKHTATCLSTIGLLVGLASSLEADDFAYMLGTSAAGVTNPFGTVDLNSGAFTLIGSMGSGGYSGLAVANGAIYTEQNGLLYSVNTSNANLVLIGGLVGNNLATFGSTTTKLYGLAGTGAQNVATLFSIDPSTGALTAIGPVGVIGNGQFSNARLSVGSSTLYMENNSNLYTINTATGAGTQVGTTSSNGYLTSVLLFENGTYYDGAGAGLATIDVTTGQITPHSSIFGIGNSSVVGLAPLSSSSSSSSYYFSQLAVGGFGGGLAFQTTLTYVNYSPQAVTCVTNFYLDSGNPWQVPFIQGSVSTRTDVLPPGGSIHDQTIASVSSQGQQGWAQATCTGPVQASLLYRLYTSGTPTGEASVSAETATTTEFATFAQTATGIAYANPSTTQSATITVTVYNASGTKLGSQVITLGPMAHGSANVGPLLGLAGFTGFVKITSTIPIISLSLNFEAFPVFSSLPPGDLPGSTILLP
jgi:hypothetical protein